MGPILYPLFEGKFEKFIIHIEIGNSGKIEISQRNIYPWHAISLYILEFYTTFFMGAGVQQRVYQDKAHNGIYTNHNSNNEKSIPEIALSHII